MTEAKKITQYIATIFQLYRLRPDGFFAELDEFGNYIKVPLFQDDTVDEDTLHRLSIHLGLTEEEILNRDPDAPARYWNKYPVFALFNYYIDDSAFQAQYKSGRLLTPEKHMLNAIFGEEEEEPIERYDYIGIDDRLLETLEGLDVYVPGTVHQDESIRDAMYSTEVAVDFPECHEMLSSFVDVVDRYKTLMYAAIEGDLSQEDANEMNFLTTWLRATDIEMPSYLCNYEHVRKCRTVLKEEQKVYKQFSSFVIIRAFADAAPWRCLEFFDDLDLVERFVEIFPFTKEFLTQYVLALKSFRCRYKWTDEGGISFEDMSDVEDIAFRNDLMYEDEWHEVYIPKTEEELFGWDEYARKIQSLIGPKGCIKIPQREYILGINKEIDMTRLLNRADLVIGGRRNG